MKFLFAAYFAAIAQDVYAVKPKKWIPKSTKIVTADTSTSDDSAEALGISSVSGPYALITTIGVNMGQILTLLTYEDGSSVGESMANLPSFNPETPTDRFLFPTRNNGTLDRLDPDGSGMQTIFLDFFTLGSSAVEPMDLQVTERQGSLATKLLGTFQNPSVAVPGALVTFDMLSRAEGGFGASSMSGPYGLTCVSGSFVGFRSGGVTFDGEGGFSGRMTQNDPDPENPIELRKIVEVDLAGTYAVADNGFAEIVFEGIGSSNFVVTANEGQVATTLTGSFAVPGQEGGLITCDLDLL